MDKVEKLNRESLKAKPLSPRLQRLFNKSTFIDRISKDQAAKTSRYEEETKGYDKKLV